MDFTIIDMTKPEGKNLITEETLQKRVDRIPKKRMNQAISELNDRYIVINPQGFQFVFGIHHVTGEIALKLPLREVKRQLAQIKQQREERKFIQKQKREIKKEQVRQAQIKQQRAERKLIQKQEKQQKIQIKKQKEEQKKQIIRNNVERYANFYELKNALRNRQGQTVVVRAITHEGVERANIMLEIPSTGFNRWWKNSGWRFMINSEELIMANGAGYYYIYPEEFQVKTTELIQAFRAGINHCFLSPIQDWILEKVSTAESQATRYRYEKLSKDIEKLLVKYENGVPENCINEIANIFQIDIEVELPFSQNTFLEAKSIKKKLRTFKFTNTRLNHVDLNNVSQESKPIFISREELLNIQNKLDNNTEYYTYKKDNIAISRISTLNKTYSITNEYSEIINNFEKETGLINLKLDDIANYELSKFIQSGTHYNATVDFKKRNIFNNPNHIDMKKAYANFWTSSYYEGFAGKITDFRKTNKIQGVGIYEIKCTDFTNANPVFVAYNKKMKIYGDGVYTSAELKFLSEQGVRYEIVGGCWGTKPFHFRFNEDMLNMKTPEGIAYYAKYIGQCDSHNFFKKVWFKADKNYVGLIKKYSDKDISIYGNEVCVKIPKKSNYHLGHITSFITAYQRLNVLEQLMTMDFNKIVRVCVDGIYYEGEKVECLNVFRDKPEINFNNEAGDSYISVTKYENYFEGEYRENYAKELFLGAGGNGKTHYNLTDKGLVRVLYVAPSWKLVRNKIKEYEVRGQVLANVITTDIEKVSEIKRYYNTILFDEVSMYSEDSKQAIFNTYDDCKIIFCGDLGFQLPCIQGEPMELEGFDKITTFTKNYRCNDIELLEILDTLREFIRLEAPIEIINNYVKSEFKKRNRIINLEKLDELYDINDMILSSTNVVRQSYTETFKGKFDKEKYYITSNNLFYSNGDIVISDKKPEKCNSEIRHCYTVHSIQGETCDTKLFIDCDNWFDERLIYTALSRARRLEQIYLVCPNMEVEEFTFKEVVQYVAKTLGINIRKAGTLKDMANTIQLYDYEQDNILIRMVKRLNKGYYLD